MLRLITRLLNSAFKFCLLQEHVVHQSEQLNYVWGAVGHWY